MSSVSRVVGWMLLCHLRRLDAGVDHLKSFLFQGGPLASCWVRWYKSIHPTTIKGPWNCSDRKLNQKNILEIFSMHGFFVVVKNFIYIIFCMDWLRQHRDPPCNESHLVEMVIPEHPWIVHVQWMNINRISKSKYRIYRYWRNQSWFHYPTLSQLIDWMKMEFHVKFAAMALQFSQKYCLSVE